MPQAERRALHGSTDLGDITGCGRLAWEVKAGAVAKAAAPASVESWLNQTELERAASGADIGLLVMARAGYGAARCGMWWTVLPMGALGGDWWNLGNVWMTLETACRWLHWMGYGESTK